MKCKQTHAIHKRRHMLSINIQMQIRKATQAKELVDKSNK